MSLNAVVRIMNSVSVDSVHTLIQSVMMLPGIVLSAISVTSAFELYSEGRIWLAVFAMQPLSVLLLSRMGSVSWATRVTACRLAVLMLACGLLSHPGPMRWATKTMTVFTYICLAANEVEAWILRVSILSELRRILRVDVRFALTFDQGSPTVSLHINCRPTTNSTAQLDVVAPVVQQDVVEEHIGSQCSICMAEFDRQSTARQTSCRHTFHSACLQEWVCTFNHTTCPICRCDLFAHGRDADL